MLMVRTIAYVIALFFEFSSSSEYKKNIFIIAWI